MAVNEGASIGAAPAAHDPARGQTETQSIANMLTPQSVTALFDEAFELYRAHFSLFALTVACIYLPSLVALAGLHDLFLLPLERELAHLDGSKPDPGTLLLYMAGATLTGVPGRGFPGLIEFGALFLASAPLTVAVSETLVGNRIRVVDAYRRAAPTLLRVLGGWILVFLAWVAVLFCVLIATLTIVGPFATLLTSARLEMIGGAIVLASMTVVPYLAVCALTARLFLFTTQLVVLEKLPVSRVSDRNRQLVGSVRFRRTFVAVIFLLPVTLGLRGLILLSLTSTLGALSLPAFAEFLLSSLFTGAVSFLFMPYWIIFVTLLYYDYRVRREGFDMRLLAGRLTEHALPGAAVPNGLAASVPITAAPDHRPPAHPASLPLPGAEESAP